MGRIEATRDREPGGAAKLSQHRFRTRRSACGALLIGGMVWAPGREASAEEGWRVTPFISIEEVFNDNTQSSSTNQQADAITEIIPEIHIDGQTARSQMFLDYAPSFQHYDFGTSPDHIDQYLVGAGSFTPLTNYLTINFNASANETSGSGNLGNTTSNTLIPSNDRVLNFGGSIETRFHDQFKSAVTLDAFYRLSSSNSSQEGGPGPFGSLSRDLLQRDVGVVIGSGQEFGRFGASINLDRTQSTGTGSASNSKNDNDFIQFVYHLTHAYALVGSVGYQNIDYAANGTAPAYKNEGLTWTAGINAAPNARSTITLNYGRQNGGYAPTLNMTYQLGPRTSVLASYVVTVQNQLQSALQTLQYLSRDEYGNPIDSRTGLPFVDVNNTFASQNSLFRDKVGTISISHQFIRSQMSFSVTDDIRDSVVGVPSTDRALGAVVTYSREFTPLMQGSVSVGYTDHKSTGSSLGGSGDSQIINTTLALSYLISNTATANLTGTYFQRISDDAGSSATTVQLTIGLRKEF